jgi:hypothetical protein
MRTDERQQDPSWEERRTNVLMELSNAMVRLHKEQVRAWRDEGYMGPSRIEHAKP